MNRRLVNVLAAVGFVRSAQGRDLAAELAMAGEELTNTIIIIIIIEEFHVKVAKM